MVKHSNVLGAPNWRDISSLASLNAKQLLTRYDSVVNMKRPFPYWDPSADVELGRPLHSSTSFVVLRRQLCICNRLCCPQAMPSKQPTSLHGDVPLALCMLEYMGLHVLACMLENCCTAVRQTTRAHQVLQYAVRKIMCLGVSLQETLDLFDRKHTCIYIPGSECV